MYAGEILWKDINIGMRALPTEMSIEVHIMDTLEIQYYRLKQGLKFVNKRSIFL
jgi:hypothetical protein